MESEKYEISAFTRKNYSSSYLRSNLVRFEISYPYGKKGFSCLGLPHENKYMSYGNAAWWLCGATFST